MLQTVETLQMKNCSYRSTTERKNVDAMLKSNNFLKGFKKHAQILTLEVFTIVRNMDCDLLGCDAL
jgi:hypothetical protein